MRITILCSDKSHPVYKYIQEWASMNAANYSIDIIERVSEIKYNGTILFLVSCSEIVKKQTRDMFLHTLVLHASDLPNGRGWSPHVWGVIEGAKSITLSLLNAEDSVDTGDIWKKKTIELDGSELHDEINAYLFEAEVELISWACENYNSITPVKQIGTCNSYHRKRTPDDSELNLDETIRTQFNLLRVCDPDRFPAYFYMNGQKYIVRIEKNDE